MYTIKCVILWILKTLRADHLNAYYVTLLYYMPNHFLFNQKKLIIYLHFKNYSSRSYSVDG